VCRALPADGVVKLGEGAHDGHAWHWTLRVERARGAVTLDGPSAKHGFDRANDTRTFEKKGLVRRFVVGPPADDVVPLYSEALKLEIACWGSHGSEATCDGKKLVCKRCEILRLIGGPRPAQRTYGDGAVRADLTEGCEKM